jgi:hypothetical protein
VAANLTVHPAQVLPAEDLAAEPLLTVAAEALTNVARHTGASQVAVTLSRRDGRAVLEIADDGLGVDVQRTPFGHRRSYPGRGARMAPRRAPPRDRSLTGRGTDPPSRDRAHAGDMTRMTRATQVLSLLLVALTMRLEFAHTLELGPKLNYSPELGCCGGGPGGCSPERH